MSIYLRSMHSDEFIEKHMSSDVWLMLRKLASMGGWQPAGTIHNGYYVSDDQKVTFPDWDGNYYMNEYQTITAADGRALAAGLKATLDDIPELSGPPTWGEKAPNLNDPVTKAILELAGEEGVVIVGANTDLSPLQFFSGSTGHAFALEMIDFFERGSCQIA